jgi:hypothetical protein
VRETIRDNIHGLLNLFASPEAQQSYQLSVPFVNVPTELLCQWADDLYHPDEAVFRKAFNPDELIALAAFDKVIQRATKTFSGTTPPLDRYVASTSGVELAGAAASVLLVLRQE